MLGDIQETSSSAHNHTFISYHVLNINFINYVVQGGEFGAQGKLYFIAGRPSLFTFILLKDHVKSLTLHWFPIFSISCMFQLYPALSNNGELLKALR